MQDLWTTTHEQYYFDFRRGRLPGMGLAPTESDLASGEVKEYVGRNAWCSRSDRVCNEKRVVFME
jgi:hypothetical protein